MYSRVLLVCVIQVSKMCIMSKTVYSRVRVGDVITLPIKISSNILENIYLFGIIGSIWNLWFSTMIIF